MDKKAKDKMVMETRENVKEFMRDIILDGMDEHFDWLPLDERMVIETRLLLKETREQMTDTFYIQQFPDIEEITLYYQYLSSLLNIIIIDDEWRERKIKELVAEWVDK